MKTTMSKRNLEGVTCYVPPEIRKKLEAWAKAEDRSVSYLVARLIIDAVNEREPEQKKQEE